MHLNPVATLEEIDPAVFKNEYYLTGTSVVIKIVKDHSVIDKIIMGLVKPKK